MYLVIPVRYHKFNDHFCIMLVNFYSDHLAMSGLFYCQTILLPRRWQPMSLGDELKNSDLLYIQWPRFIILEIAGQQGSATWQMSNSSFHNFISSGQWAVHTSYLSGFIVETHGTCFNMKTWVHGKMCSNHFNINTGVHSKNWWPCCNIKTIFSVIWISCIKIWQSFVMLSPLWGFLYRSDCIWRQKYMHVYHYLIWTKFCWKILTKTAENQYIFVILIFFEQVENTFIWYFEAEIKLPTFFRWHFQDN